MGLKKSFVDWLTERRIRVLDNKVRLLTIRMIKLEDRVAIDSDTLAQLNTATSRVAARVSNLVEQVVQLRGQIDESTVADAEALRPVIEQLQKIGADAADPVPAPSDGQVATDPNAGLDPVEAASDVPVPTGDDAQPTEG